MVAPYKLISRDGKMTRVKRIEFEDGEVFEC